MTYKEIVNPRVLTRKNKGASPKARASFLILYTYYIQVKGVKSVSFYNFICRMNPTAYAKKVMLRVLTSSSGLARLVPFS